jgi:hypothetical protein
VALVYKNETTKHADVINLIKLIPRATQANKTGYINWLTFFRDFK